MIIDAHAHADENDIWGWYDPPEKVIALMDEAGIDKAIITSYSDAPGPGGGLNNLIKYIEQYPDRLYGFPRMDPKFGDEAVELFVKTIKENEKMRGLKLHPISNLVKPYAPLCLSLIKKAGELGVPVFIHSGDKIPALPLQIARAAELCPETTIICHMGGYFLGEEMLCAAQRLNNIMLDTSSIPYPELIQKAIDRLGPERVVFATDNPAGDPISELEKIRMLNITTEIEERILYRNIAECIGLENTGRTP